MIKKYSSISKIGKYEIVDGGLLIKDVKIMASGIWHAINAFYPIRYGETVLSQYANNWSDKSVWSTHDQNRSITKLIGEIQNPHYEDSACMGDVFLHGKTQESKESIELITAGLVDSISAEIAIIESTYCAQIEADNAKNIEFVSAAIVPHGACKVCKLNQENDKMVEIEELETKLAELTAKVDSLVIPEATEAVDIAPLTKELETTKTALGEAVKQNKALEERIVKLEKAPVEITTQVNSEKVFDPFE